MSSAPSLDDIFAVMAAVSFGQGDARVSLPADPEPDDVSTRFAIALNVLLDDLAFRATAEHAARTAAEVSATALLRVEEQLRQSQKMEAIGRLAGGVAHDFNNVLSVILSCSEFLLADMTPDEPMRGDVLEIGKAARRAADLTRQLLMYSRQQVLEPRVLDLNDMLAGMNRMLLRILGANIELISSPMQPLGHVRVDPSSMEQVIVNLVVNARDAMPAGGRLTMHTADVILDDAVARCHLGATPGPHVMLGVADTGCGMDASTLAQMFEPFFTTKTSGTGTGLGLSTVQGIVEQSGGSIRVRSAPDVGTAFEIYLPRVDAAVDAARLLEPPITSRGSETILLVEDDEHVRAVACGILRGNGYLVMEAHDAAAALLRAERYPGTIDLLVTDIDRPHMTGSELARRLVLVRPAMKVLSMSGHPDPSILGREVDERRIAYLQKPITPFGLTARVRELLDAPA